MDIKEILSKCDHTLLSPTATWEDIMQVIDDGIKYGTASVCIPPCYVKLAKLYAKDAIPICTVIGFPNGNCSRETKVFETQQAIADGADEIDMVINIGDLKAKNYAAVMSEICLVKMACAGKILKVIIETCLLTDEEKIVMCDLISQGSADYIKTSTGFSKGGATREDVALIKKHLSRRKKIKAAGGIATLQDAEDFIKLGASRLGTSRIVKLVKEGNLL